MTKVVFFAFKNSPMCFQHLMLNAFDIIKKGGDAKIIFEGEAVKLPQALTEANNPLFKKALEEKVIEGVCEACSKSMEAYEFNKELGLNFLSEMSGHPAMNTYLEQGYELIIL